MSSLIKPVQGVIYTPDRVGYIRAVSRKESGSDLRYSYTYTGDNQEAIKVDNPTAVSILNPWNYVGLFQFSEEALQDVGCYRFDGTKNSKTQDWGGTGNYWTGKFGATSLNVFKSSGTIQMKAINEWINRLCRYSRSKNLNEFYGVTITGASGYEDFEVTESGVIAAIHLKGSGAVKSFLTTNGKTNESDANGTSIAKYMNMFAHYDIQTCCKRKIYVKIVDAKKVGIPNKEVEISSEYKGKFSLGKIVVTHKTDEEGNLPVIVRHPNAKIQLKIDGKLVEAIVQKSEQVQGYEIVYLGKHNYSSKLSEHEKLEATQESTDSNNSISNDESTSSDQPNESTTDRNIVDEVTFNIKLVEGDTGKPLPNTTYHLEYKNNIKPHKTDSSGIESGITADVSQSISVYLDDDGGKKQSIYSMAFPVIGDLNGQTKILEVPVVTLQLIFVDENKKPVPNYEFKTVYRGRISEIKKANARGIATVKALAGQKLKIIHVAVNKFTSNIVTDGSTKWTYNTDKLIEDPSNSPSSTSNVATSTPSSSQKSDNTKPSATDKGNIIRNDKITPKGPTHEIKTDKAKITIKFLDEDTNKPLSGLTYWTQSTKYGKNASTTGSDGTRSRTHDSDVGVSIAVLVNENGKEVKKGTIIATSDKNGTAYVYKAKKPEIPNVEVKFKTKRTNVVTEKSKNILCELASQYGMKTIYITSTLRTPEEQARAMYNNIANGRVIRYAAPGAEVTRICQNGIKKGLGKTKTINNMVSKILEYDKKGIRVSKHCVSFETYAKKNIIDLGVNSNGFTSNAQKRKFQEICDLALNQGKLSSFISPLRDKAEPAFHLEIPQ